MPVLVVQMGHVGRTSGATGAPGEMRFTQRVGEACARLLGGGAWSVRVVPADPVRSAYRGDAFVAVHADGNNNPAVSGASVGYQTPEGGALARAWRDAYAALGWAGRWNRDNYTANLAGYYGVSYAVAQGNRRACIVECGTITNPAEREAMTSPTGVDRVALAIGAAVGILTEPIEEADVHLSDTGIPYPYKDQGDANMSVSRALGFAAYIPADMAKDDAGVPGQTFVDGSNRLSIPALRDDVDRLHAKVDALMDLVNRTLGGG